MDRGTHPFLLGMVTLNDMDRLEFESKSGRGLIACTSEGTARAAGRDSSRAIQRGDFRAHSAAVLSRFLILLKVGHFNPAGTRRLPARSPRLPKDMMSFELSLDSGLDAQLVKWLREEYGIYVARRGYLCAEDGRCQPQS